MKNIIFTGILLLILFAVIFFFSGIKKEETEINNTKPEISSRVDFTDSIINHNPEIQSDTIKPHVTISNEKPAAKDSAKKHIDKKVIVYYFHPTARCPTCINIENYTKESVETNFKKEQKNKKVYFRSVNIEDSLNEHFVDEFNLTSSSVVLVMYEGKKRKGWKNLEKVWTMEKEKDKFALYIKIELKQFLKKLEEEES